MYEYVTKDYDKIGQTTYNPAVSWMVEDPNGEYMADDANYRAEYKYGPQFKGLEAAINWIKKQKKGEQGHIERSKWTADEIDDEEYGLVGDATVENESVAYAWRGEDGDWSVEKEV